MDSLDNELLLRLRATFQEMEASRTRLRPILSDIADSIDKGLFIDAASEEVNTLLKQILEAQEKFLNIEQTKRAATLKRLDAIDKALLAIEETAQRGEILQTLSRILTITLDSQEPKIIEALKRVKLQAEHLKGKVNKIEIQTLLSQAEKFVFLDELVSSGKVISPEKYLEALNYFSDNPILLMALSQDKLHLPKKFKPAAEVEPPQKVEEKPETKSELEPSSKAIVAVHTKYKKIQPPPDLSLVLFKDEDFTIEKSTTKKNFGVKSFQKKLHELLEVSDPSVVLQFLIESRIFFKDNFQDLKPTSKLSRRLTVIFPVALERFFAWGIVDKVMWRGIQFYFLNNSGYELCNRAFRNAHSSSSEGTDFEELIHALKYSSMKIMEFHIKNGHKINFEYHPQLPFVRAEYRAVGGLSNVFVMISLTLLGENWAEIIAKFKVFIESELNRGIEIRAMFVFAFDKDKDLSWLKIFDTAKFRGIHFFLCTPHGIFDETGEEVDFKDWMSISKLERPVSQNPPKLPTKIPESVEPDTIDDSADNFFFIAPTKDSAPAAPEFTEAVEEIVDVVAEIEPEPITPPEESAPVEDTNPDEESQIPLPDEEEENSLTAEEAPDTTETDLVKVDTVTGIKNLFKIGDKSRAMLALHSLKEFVEQTKKTTDTWATHLANEIGFILDDPLTLQTAQNLNPFMFWANTVEIPKANVGKTFDYLNLAALIKVFFAPPDPTSYQLQKSWRQINEDNSNSALKAYPAAKHLINLFNNFASKTHRAFADCLEGAGNPLEEAYKNSLAQIRTAEDMTESALHLDVNHRHFRDVLNQAFSIGGQVRKYLRIDEYTPEEILEFCRRFESTDLQAVLDDNSVRIDDKLFSDDKIESFFEELWDNPHIRGIRQEREPFKGQKRTRAKNVVKYSLAALLNYLRAKKSMESTSHADNPTAPVDKALEHLKNLKQQLSHADKKANLGQIVFNLFVENLERRLNGENITLSYRECVLTSCYVELDADLPVLDSFGIEEFSLKNRVMKFEEALNSKDFDTALKDAYETALRHYDCGILQYIAKFFVQNLYVTEEDVKRKINAINKHVDNQIERTYNEFLSDLELARNYSRITDQEKIEFYINAAVTARQHFLQTKNAGLFEKFIDACNESIVKASIPQKNALKSRLTRLEDDLSKTLKQDESLEERYPILANIHHQIELMNLTVAEDYMNRLETEGGNLLTELNVAGYDLSILDNFLNEYETLFRAIQSAGGSVEGAFRRRLPHTTKPNREAQNALEFLHGWQGIHSGHNITIESSIMEILKHLGYKGGKVIARNTEALNKKSYTLAFDKPSKPVGNYPHPFAVFGTDIYTKGLEVIYLGANRNSENIESVLSEMVVDRGTICLADISLTSADRRKLARTMKSTATLKNIIVLDKVMALYLARFDDDNRVKRMLQTALPFARVQPYTAGGIVPPEMFIGRSEELDQICDMAGPVFVYGGRQLGKSALLRQVRNIEHYPNNGNYALFIDLKNLNGEQSLRRIVEELANANLMTDAQNWNDFSRKMRKLLNGQIPNVSKPNKLLLLLDESDTFLSQPDSEVAINVLRELFMEFNGQFKFVLAGLHKVIRFEKNSSFGNLNHISVLPFKPADAMELLVKPMSWLGFKISDESLVSAIFSRTNYYPGSIQYYCKMLVDAVGANYTNNNFDIVKNPPYNLNDDYLKNMLGNTEFQEEIRNKFRITLCLDDDNYYEILALAVAMVYHENGRPVGVSLKDIRDYCLMCGVEKIGNLSDAELLSLLDEMVTLNLFRMSDGKYEFNRYAFWHMMGTADAVNKKLDSYGTFSGHNTEEKVS